MEKYQDEIQEDIREISKKEQRREISLENCKKQTNQLLEQEKYGDLLGLFQTDEFRELAKIDNSFAIMSIILSIYHMEQEEQVVNKILSGIHDMQTAENKYLTVKFLMWRLEFAGETVELEEQIQQEKISVSFMKYLIHTSSFEKAITAYKMAMLYKNKRRYANAFGMLRYVNELSPDEEIVFCEMADICMGLGRREMAETCIKQIKAPTELSASYQKRWENMKNECQ